jgi:hypothetical protein
VTAYITARSLTHPCSPVTFGLSVEEDEVPLPCRRLAEAMEAHAPFLAQHPHERLFRGLPSADGPVKCCTHYYNEGHVFHKDAFASSRWAHVPGIHSFDDMKGESAYW